jgi:hypothetical protein
MKTPTDTRYYYRMNVQLFALIGGKMGWLTQDGNTALPTRLIALLLLLPLSACGLFMSKETRALRKSPDYRVGYQDGCNSAQGPGADKSRASDIVRDEEAWRTSKAYRAGWGRGQGACRSTGYTGGALPGTVPYGGPVRDPVPGQPRF